jgi:hypothetical protein
MENCLCRPGDGNHYVYDPKCPLHPPEDYAVYEFSKRMIFEIHQNNHKGHWKNLTNDFLVKEIQYHVDKLLKANTTDELAEYSADIANLSMMIWDNNCAKRQI